MNELFGNVCCAGIDTDPDLKYPKGAARVTFTTRESYLKAIEVRFVEVQMPDQRKRVSLIDYNCHFLRNPYTSKLFVKITKKFSFD